MLLFLLLATGSFAQTFLISDTGPIYTCSGTLYDSGGPSGDYGDDENYVLTIYSDNGDALIAQIAEFKTQHPDVLRIYDGPDTSGPLLAEHITSVTGTPSYLSSGDCLTFEFITNTGSVDPGFRINLSCTPIVAGYLISDGGPLSLCSGNLFDSGGPGLDYGPNEDHEITIYSADGRSVELDFLSLDLASGDNLMIFDGPTTAGDQLADLSSGSSPGVYTSSGTSLTLHFTSDNDGSEAAGWVASISCVPVAIGYLISDGGTVNTCSGRVYDTGGQGGEYSPGEDFEMTFCSDDGSALVLDFSVFEYADKDYFYVYDGPDSDPVNSPLLAAITNSNAIPGPFTSSGTCLTIRSFSDNNAFVGDGFAANLSCTPVVPGYLISDGGTVNTCGGNFFDSGGQGGNYGPADNYTMTFCSDDGSALEVDFGSIDIRDGDYLYIYDGSSTSDPLMATFTSTTTVQGPFASSGTCLTFMFTADGGITGSGFASVISCIDPCEGLPVLTFGAIADVCEGAAPINLTQAAPAGGTYSGTGITTSPEFDPSVAGIGIHTISYTLTDINGCTNSIDQTVTVFDDVTAPVISGCPANITVIADTSYCGAEVTWTAPTATDNCSVTLTTTHNPGDTFPVGTTTVTYTATDGAGLIDQCSFDITIEASVPPTISGPQNVCNPSTETYAVSDPGTHTFLWTATNGTIVGENTNSTVDVLWTVQGLGTVSVEITSGSGCTNSNNITVDVSSIAAPGEINSGSSLTRR